MLPEDAARLVAYIARMWQDEVFYRTVTSEQTHQYVQYSGSFSRTSASSIYEGNHQLIIRPSGSTLYVTYRGINFIEITTSGTELAEAKMLIAPNERFYKITVNSNRVEVLGNARYVFKVE